ncbi:MAG: hypothetical protein H6712_17355 [Myxococcales bacterium]|nr:hypothetical protein [Myxococcales bacterium]MCB9715640.1 hypothetical protein [Myxococcales bacterium]
MIAGWLALGLVGGLAPVAAASGPDGLVVAPEEPEVLRSSHETERRPAPDETAPDETGAPRSSHGSELGPPPDEPATSDVVAPTGAPPTALSPPRFEEPRRIVGRDRRPTGWVTQRYTRRSPLVRPALRLAPGFSARLTGRPYAAFGLDVLASVMVGLHGGYRQWGLAPELGYSLRAPGADHQLLMGLGVVQGINVEGLTVGWLPRVVLQPLPGQLGLGLRNGLWLDFAENGFSIELAHQYMRLPGADVHELRIGLGIDLAMLAFVLSGARMAWL